MSVFNITSVCPGVPLSQVKPLPPPEAGEDGTFIDKLNKNTGRTNTATGTYIGTGMHVLK